MMATSGPGSLGTSGCAMCLTSSESAIRNTGLLVCKVVVPNEYRRSTVNRSEKILPTYPATKPSAPPAAILRGSQRPRPVRRGFSQLFVALEIALIVVGGIFVAGGSFVTASYLWSEVSSQVDAARIQSDAVN